MENPPDKSASNRDLLDESKDISNSEKSNKERREKYFNQLRAWLTIMKSYHGYYNQLQHVSLQNIIQQVPKDYNETAEDIPNTVPENVPNTAPEILQESESEILNDPNQLAVIQCLIPPLWKRFLAEAMDLFMIHFFHVVVYIIRLLGGKDEPFFSNYYEGILVIFNGDYSKDYAFLLNILLVLIIHRFVLTSYELMLYLWHYLYTDHDWPTISREKTVGKLLLGLTVVKVDEIYHIRDQPDDVIILTIGRGLEWDRSRFRLIIKNFIFMFLFPLPFINASTNYNRSIYDVLSGTIVVECIQPLEECEECDADIDTDDDIYYTDEESDIEQNVDIDIDICRLIYK